MIELAGEAGRIDPAASGWQAELRSALRSVDALVQAGLVPLAEAARQKGELGRFAICVPRALAARFDTKDLSRCPLYRQAVPSAREREPEHLPKWAHRISKRLYGRPVPWGTDPIGDVAHLAAPRLTHRYRARALLHVTHACALYCRYCFRKAHLTAREDELYEGALKPALAYLQATPSIREVVVTGGDPFTLTDVAWARLLAALSRCEGLDVVRLHTRLPTVLPSRLTAALCQALTSTRLQVVVVCHANHPAEWDEPARQGLRRLRQAGVPLLLQSVLLAGINDDHDTLQGLWSQAYACGVLPYYLHHPDWTVGTWGFRLGIDRGRALMAGLAGEVSGPALPRYVLDVPGGAGKVDLMGHGVVKRRAYPAEGGIAGAVWRLTLPQTRASRGPAHGPAAAPATADYLDLFGWQTSSP